MISAKVKWFNDAKGYGFVTLDDGRDVFLHYTQITGDGFKTLTEGQTITFELYEETRGLIGRNITKDA